jgi:hypothetical protein
MGTATGYSFVICPNSAIKGWTETLDDFKAIGMFEYFLMLPYQRSASAAKAHHCALSRARGKDGFNEWIRKKINARKDGNPPMLILVTFKILHLRFLKIDAAKVAELRRKRLASYHNAVKKVAETLTEQEQRPATNVEEEDEVALAQHAEDAGQC